VNGRVFPVREPTPAAEHRHVFECFGSTCTVIVADRNRPADAAAAAAMAKRSLLSWHERFSRFEPDSELTRFNLATESEIKVSPLLRRLLEASIDASLQTDGLVDAMLGAEIVRAGYRSHFSGGGIDLPTALSQAPPRQAAGPASAPASDRFVVDSRRSIVRRPPGTVFDPGGIAKGVFADELAAMLEGFDAFAIDCGGDVRIGGSANVRRPVHVSSPFDDSVIHTFELAGGGVATSGIGKRSWIGGDGLPAHHLLDPRTGRPAFTGIVQATALAQTAAQAEVLAKAAVLSGPERAPGWLGHGGVLVPDDGSCQVLEPAGLEVSPVAARAGARSASHARMSASTASRSGSLRISWNRPS
jgi:thiamine biosynthesis lipoprotein